MKTILAHLDDVGCSPGSVRAWQALRRAGVVRSASVMVPCPWYPMARDDWQEAGQVDVGVHITLTSEWEAYRWRPMVGTKGGLTDSDGFFHSRPNAVLQNADRSAVADEIAAQIERVLADGVKPTHLDAHMGTALRAPFVWDLMEAGARHDIPVLCCLELADLAGTLGLVGYDPGYLTEVAAECRHRGWPVFDRFMMGFCPDDQAMGPFLNGLLDEIGDGLIYYALHADTSEGFADFAQHHEAPRRKEFELFAEPGARTHFYAAKARLVNWTDLA